MGPIACSYYVTTICNAKCGFCDIWTGRASEKPKLQPVEECERIIKGLKSIGVRYIDFTGGEPLLARNLPDLLRAAKRLGIKTGLVSNGLLYPSRSKDMAGLVDSMSFSLDSADRDRHNASRGLKCYDKVMESLEMARRMKQFVNINFSVGNENLHEIPGMLQLARNLKVVVYVMPMFAYFGNAALKKDYIETLRTMFGKPYVSLNLAALKFVENGGNDPEKPKCKAISANVAVSQDGKFLLPCYHAAVEKVPIAEDMAAQWKSPEMDEHRQKAGRYDFCKGCTIWCYISPSFFYSLDKYFLLQAYSFARTSAKISMNRVQDAIRFGRERTREQISREIGGRTEPAP